MAATFGRRFVSACALIALTACVSSAAQAQSGRTAAQARQRGAINCGVAQNLKGFAMRDEAGKWSGFDVDFCRALATAVLGDPAKVNFTPLNASERFAALETGKVDILARNTTWTFSREATQKFRFGPITYFDGQTFIVRRRLNATNASELSGARICVQKGTTSESNLSDFFRAHEIKYQPVPFETAEEAISAYDENKCDAYSTDSAQAYITRARLAAPAEHDVLVDSISKEPLGPVVRQDDENWFTLTRWIHYLMISAEELEITSQNIDQITKSSNPDIRRITGQEDDFGAALGLSRDWPYQVIKTIGNYGEVFERNLGESSGLKIKRGQNALWSKGGLQYAPPFR